ncbi:MAG TPA: formate C-acetyltransferase [Candidatus Scatosoma pullistercoris]|uniref:Formate acetyltransferase n=1 Tax=Candidatus Scatosoma pullistercoris TaxID=2840934 RepID=A0A9D1SFS3_9FIRM|nr:formate C-acetyltransferase [Candidatus Scatosoma pullistercoris]
MQYKGWEGFIPGKWNNDEVDVRDFIQRNYTPYEGDASFLAPATEATKKLWDIVLDLSAKERAAGGVLDADTKIVSTLTSHAAGYLDKDLEKIVGLQTDKPFKRSLQPFGGIRMSEEALNMYGYTLDPEVKEIFSKYRKTHNDGVYDAYTPEMRAARSAHILTGLPDTYGRGRIVGDYRRVALYGVDYLIRKKEEDKLAMNGVMTPDKVRDREELSEQIKALKALKQMAAIYGRDISQPATTAQEAVQALYFGYLAAVKDQNGAAMSIGRNSTFLDIYIERDLKNGVITETEAQELIDQFVMKLRIVKFMRIKEYNELFSGDPTWVTESIGGMGVDGRTLVTKNSFRILHTLDNLGPAPEPNLTVLWSKRLPANFKKYCAEISIRTSAIQYESDDLMRPEMGDDYCIACCVSCMRVGKDMQFFGARANLAKCLLYAINGGKDELMKDKKTGKPMQVSPEFAPVSGDGPLDYDEVLRKYRQMMKWLAELYVNTLNLIHYMHDKYSYEALEMALHDTKVRRFFATGIAGLSCAVDSLSAIKYAKVYPVRNEEGIVTDFRIEGDFPKYGNNDDRVDEIAVWLLKTFMTDIRSQYTYRESIPTTSILTITSNVVYGKKTGNTPDGRRAGTPLAPGANPMHGRDTHGALASLESVAKLPYEYSRDGISNTFSITPGSLGKDD